MIVHEVLYKVPDQLSTEDIRVYLVFGSFRDHAHGPIMNGVWFETVHKDGSVNLKLIFGGSWVTSSSIDAYLYKMMKDQD